MISQYKVRKQFFGLQSISGVFEVCFFLVTKGMCTKDYTHNSSKEDSLHVRLLCAGAEARGAPRLATTATSTVNNKHYIGQRKITST